MESGTHTIIKGLAKVEKMLKFFLKKIKIPPMKLKKYFGQITKNKKPEFEEDVVSNGEDIAEVKD